MGIGRLLRSAVPPERRAALRRIGVVNRALAYWYGGVRSRPHPFAPYRLYFDGYRNLGWAIGDVTDIEPEEMHFAGELLKRRQVSCAWDVGANVGLWTLFLAGVRPEIGRIVSFEPDLTNQRLLRTNVEKNQLEGRVSVRDVALSDQPGEATFYGDPLTGSTGGLEKGAAFIEEHYGARRQEVKVRVTTVDAEVAAGTPPPQFMKIDVEGHELGVLRGARETLTRHRPVLLMEVTRNQDEVGRLVRELGYRMLAPGTGKELDRPEFATACVHADDLDAVAGAA